MTTVYIEMNNSEHVNKIEDNENEKRQNNTENKTTSNSAKDEQTENISRFREVLPQFLANFTVNLVTMDLSIIINYSTVVIATLHHAEGDLSLDDNKASWMGSIAYICQPLGSMCSGIMVERLGRKRSLLFINVLYFIAWMLLYTAPNFTFLLIANFVIGVSVGLTEAPLINYGGEITQPHIRGTVIASGALFFHMGMFIGFLVGTLTDWRTTAAICSSVPVITFLINLLLPETPPYLVSKGKIKEAEKSLCWLRGWVKPRYVQQELKDLIKIHEEDNVINRFPQHNKQPDMPVQEVNLLLHEKMQHREESLCKRVMNNITELFKPHTLRPLMIVIPLFASSNLTGVSSVRPYMVHVFTELRQVVDPKWATVMVSVCNMVACIMLILTVKIMGKRRMTLIFTAVSAFMSLLLGMYAFSLREDSQDSWIPVVIFFVLSFATTIISQLPWMLMCEVFPFRTRGLASGFSAAILYVIVFCASNTYLNLEKAIGIHGSFWLFSAVNFVMILYLYCTLLETEGKSLYEIECHFRNGLFLK